MILVPRCSICKPEATAAINRSLSAGVPYRTLAAQYGVSPSALSRPTRHIDRQPVPSLSLHSSGTFRH